MASSDLEKELMDVATSLEWAAQSFKQGKLQDAEPVYKHALEVLERAFGPSDPNTISCMQSLGDLYYAMGRHKEAMTLYKRLLVLGEKAMGKTDPRVIEIVARLARTYEQLGLHADAETMFRRANREPEESVVEPEEALSAGGKKKAPPKKAEPKKKKPEKSKQPKPDPNYDQANDRSGQRIRAPQYKINPILDFLITLKGYTSMIFAVIGIIFLFGFAWVLYLQLGTPVVKVAAKEVKGQKQSFASADNQITLALNEKGQITNYSVLNTPVAGTVTFYGPDLWDFKETIASSLLNKEIWYERVTVGLRGEDGSFLYLRPSSEARVIDELDRLKSSMTRCMLQNHTYPTKPEEMVSYAYINPCTGRQEAPELAFFESKAGAVNDVPLPASQQIYPILEAMDTANWRFEKPGSPGAIHCLSVVYEVGPNFMREFYFHGFDHNGNLIQGSKSNSCFVTGMHNGDLFPHTKVEAFRKGGRPVKVCIVKPPSANTPLWFLHYFMPIFCAGMSLLFFIGDKMGRPAGQKWSPEKTSAPMRLCYVFGLVALVYLVSYLAP